MLQHVRTIHNLTETLNLHMCARLIWKQYRAKLKKSSQQILMNLLGISNKKTVQALKHPSADAGTQNILDTTASNTYKCQ